MLSVQRQLFRLCVVSFKAQPGSDEGCFLPQLNGQMNSLDPEIGLSIVFQMNSRGLG